MMQSTELAPEAARHRRAPNRQNSRGVSLLALCYCSCCKRCESPRVRVPLAPNALVCWFRGSPAIAVRFSVDVERDCLERERRSSCSLDGSSSCTSSLSGTGITSHSVTIDMGLLKVGHTYQAYAVEVTPGSTLSEIRAADGVVIDIAGTPPRLRVRLHATGHGALSHEFSAALHEGGAKHELQVQVLARVLEHAQGTPVLRPNVTCVCTDAPEPRTSQDSWRTVSNRLSVQ